MKINKLIGFAMCFLFLGACSEEKIIIDCPAKIIDRTPAYDGYELAWAEEFESSPIIDENIWNYEEGYKRDEEFQDYRKSPETAKIDDGKLVITAIRDPHDGENEGEPYHFEFSSASLTTQGKMDFEYGRIDIAARIPMGRGIHPALRLLPTDNVYDDAYAEIDLMEYVYGNDKDHNTIEQFIHTQNTMDGLDRTPQGAASSASLGSNFHLYSIIWEKNSIELLFDNQSVLTYQKGTGKELHKQWPFDQPFYLMMNVAVGGGWAGTWGIDGSAFPQSMEVEYVRYYKKTAADNGGDGETGEPKINLFTNGNFESYALMDEVVLKGRPKDESSSGFGVPIQSNLQKWSAPITEFFTIDEAGAEGTEQSLKFKLVNDKSDAVWDRDLYYNLQGIAAGEYSFSFYAKANQAAPFVICLALDETKEDMKEEYTKHKTIVFNDKGKQSIKGGIKKDPDQKNVYATAVRTANFQWEKFTVNFMLPKNELLRLVLKPVVNGTVGESTYTAPANAADIEMWFDEFSLERIGDATELPDENIVYIKNGGFEEPYPSGKEPLIAPDAVVGGGSKENPALLKYVDRWNLKGPNAANGGVLEVDRTTGANGSISSLKAEATNGIADYWTYILRTPLQDVSEGKYRLSFYVKSNRTDGSNFATCLAFCETENDIYVVRKDRPNEVNLDSHSFIWTNGDKQEIVKSGTYTAKLLPLLTGTATDQWTQFTIDVDIPENVLIHLDFKMHVNFKSNSYVAQDTKQKITYWFDDIQLERLDE